MEPWGTWYHLEAVLEEPQAFPAVGEKEECESNGHNHGGINAIFLPSHAEEKARQNCFQDVVELPDAWRLA